MTATVRSVRVVMEAEVAKYIADMKAAGRATREAFDESSTSIGRTGRDIDGLGTSARTTSREVDGLGDSLGRTKRRTKEWSLEAAIAEERSARLRKTLREQARASLDAEEGLDGLGRTAQRSEREIDRLSGRVRLLAEAGVVLGPGLIPLIAGIAPAAAGGVAGLGAIGGGAGVAALAFTGLGDALEAVREYELDPTEANLRSMQQELDRTGRSGTQFVRYLSEIEDELKSLQLVARNQMLPGVEDGIDMALQRLPQARRLIGSFASELGDLSSDAGQALASEEWTPFFDYLASDGVPTLDQVSRGLGNMSLGVANLIVGFAPLTRMMTGGFAGAMEDFADWSAELDSNEGFQNFLAYAQANAPKVIDLIGATGSAVAGLANAAAPVGELVLPTLTALLEVIGAIGQSDMGPALYTAAAGMLVFNRASKGLPAISTSLTRIGDDSTKASKGLGSMAAKAGGILLLGQALGAVGDSLDVGNRVNSSDLARDIEKISSGSSTKSLDRLVESLEDVNEAGAGTVSAILSVPGAFLGMETSFKQGTATIEEFDQQLAQMVESGKADEAAALFERIRDAAAEHGGVSDADVVKRFDSYRTAVENAARVNEHYASGLGAVREAAQITEAEIQGLTDAMNEQADAALAAFDAETAWRQAMKGAAAQAKESNAGIRGSSKAALANREALSQLAGAWNNQSEAVRNNMGRYRAARKTFIDTAEAMGVPRAAAKRLADAILAVPKARAVKISVNKGEIDAAAGRLASLKATIDGLRSKTVTVTVQQRGMINKTIGMIQDRADADGGFYNGPVRAFANGGFGSDGRYYPRIPQIVTGGRNVVWGELETGWEAYISGKPGMRDRNLAVLSEAADRLGATLLPFADGGTAGRRLTGDRRERFFALAGDADAKIERLARLANIASLKQLQRAVNESKDALDAETSVRDSLVSSISTGLSKDWFAAEGSPWSRQHASGSVAGTNATLRTQIQEAQEFKQLTQALQARGLSGAAYDELVRGGDINRVRMFAAASDDELRQYQALAPEAQAAVAGAADAAGGFGYDANIETLTAQLTMLQRVEQRLQKIERNTKDGPRKTGESVGQNVKSPAANGARRNRRGRGRR